MLHAPSAAGGVPRRGLWTRFGALEYKYTRCVLYNRRILFSPRFSERAGRPCVNGPGIHGAKLSGRATPTLDTCEGVLAPHTHTQSPVFILFLFPNCAVSPLGREKRQCSWSTRFFVFQRFCFPTGDASFERAPVFLSLSLAISFSFRLCVCVFFLIVLVYLSCLPSIGFGYVTNERALNRMRSFR